MNELVVHDKTFNIEKRNGMWQTTYRDAKATEDKYKKEAVNQLKAISKEELLDACAARDKQIAKDTFFKEHTEEFTRIFGFPPPRDYFLYIVGAGLTLDVIALDKRLRTPDGISTNDFILKNYGQHALDLVRQMV